MQRSNLLIALILVIVFLAYHQTLGVYFSQDDFFHFKVSQTDGTFLGFLKLFGFYSFAVKGIAFYRPLFRELLYHTFYNFFGLNPFPFRILALSLHLVNTYLVYLFIKRVANSNFVTLFTALFFGISSANVALLYYLAGGIQAIGATFFMLLTLLLFERSYILSLITFILSLASHELAAITPILLFGLMLLQSRKLKLFEIFKKLLPFLILVAIYLALETLIIGLSPKEKQYQAVFNPKTTLNTLMWYGLWALGLPEMLVDFVGSSFNIKPQLFRFWGMYYTIIFSSFTIADGVILLSIINFIKKSFLNKDKKIIYFLLWFPICLLPVLFLPAHKSTHYLTPSLIGIWSLIGLLIFGFYRQMHQKFPILARSLLAILIADLLLLNLTSIKLEDTVYWAASRGRLAEKILSDIKSNHPTLPKGAIIYFENDPDYPHLTNEWGGTSRQVAYTINNDLALQLLYNDPTIRVCYQDLSADSEACKKTPILVLTAKLN